MKNNGSNMELISNHMVYKQNKAVSDEAVALTIMCLSKSVSVI
jgi:hypothetical protein